MPRKRRFFLPDVPVHVVQRGNNRQAIFFDDNDYRACLDWLGEAAAAHVCAIHENARGLSFCLAAMASRHKGRLYAPLCPLTLRPPVS